MEVKARTLEVGDAILKHKKKFVIKMVRISDGRVLVETSGGHLSFKPDDMVEIE